VTDGSFYIVQLVPELSPNRVKLGWARNPALRLRQHKTSPPTARLVRSWPCRKSEESRVISALTRRGCQAISTEVFDATNLTTLLASADALLGECAVAKDERLLTVRDVAQRARVSEKTVRRWLREGKLHGRMLGGTKIGYRVLESDLQRFLLGPERREDQA